jgi:hypothetical protein
MTERRSFPAQPSIAPCVDAPFTWFVEYIEGDTIYRRYFATRDAARAALLVISSRSRQMGKRNCGECLMNDVEVVELDAAGKCPRCGADYGPDQSKETDGQNTKKTAR